MKTVLHSARLIKLKAYVQADAAVTGLRTPEQDTPEALADFMSVAGESLFLPGDPNLDNAKRNVAIQVFLTFEMSEIVEFGRAWLRRWQQNTQERWYQEWVDIIDRADCTELSDILLSHDQERVRQRLSMPFAEMLGFSVVLDIKRRGRFEK